MPYAPNGRPYTEYILQPPPASWIAKQAVKKALEEQKKKDEEEAKKKKEEEEKEAEIKKKLDEQKKKEEEEVAKRVNDGILDGLKKLGVGSGRSRSRDSSMNRLVELPSRSSRSSRNHRSSNSTLQITNIRVGPNDYTASSHRRRDSSESSSDRERKYLVHKPSGSTRWKTRREIERNYKPGRWITGSDGSLQWVCR